MADMALDTHAFVKTLTAADMPEAQAEAVTSVVRQSHEKWLETLVTKDVFNSGLGETEGRLKFTLADSEGKLKLALAETENRLRVIHAETKADIMKWMIGTVGGAVIINAMTIIGAMLALTKMGGH